MKKLLIVEDEVPLLQVLSSQFDRKEFEVFEATDGEKGLKTALSKHPDLILLDLIMPKMDGMTMLKKLRLDHWGEKVEVIILTNLSSDDKVAEAIKQGSFDYLVKTDWNITDVVKKVKQKLGMK